MTAEFLAFIVVLNVVFFFCLLMVLDLEEVLSYFGMFYAICICVVLIFFAARWVALQFGLPSCEEFVS